MANQKGTLYPVAKEVLKTPVVVYTTSEIKLIRILMGKTNREFADIFGLSVDEIKGWQAKEGTDKHRDPSPLACKMLYWCAVVANESPSCQGNRLRLAAKHGPAWLEKKYFPRG